MIKKTCFSDTNFNLKKLSWLLLVKLVQLLTRNILQNRVAAFKNDKKNINYFGRTPLFLLLEFWRQKK